MNKKKGRYYRLLTPFLVLCVITALLFIENLGVLYEKSDVTALFANGQEDATPKVEEDIKCLVLGDATQNSSIQAEKQLISILDSMRIAYTLKDINSDSIGALKDYENIIISCADLEPLDHLIMDVFSWVKEGGKLMFAQTLDITIFFEAIKSKLGIFEGGDSYSVVESFTFETDFMIGGKGQTFYIDEAYESSLMVSLDNKCIVHMVSGGDKKIPLIWETPYGQGKIVVNNHGVTLKAARGILSAAYSLLDDVCAYPVINLSSFFLDDFPSPVPDSYNEYISRDYHVSISSFYRNIWWPDILELGNQYHLKYSGMIIERYSNEVQAPFEQTQDESDFKFFGGMLLKAGGELGLHGYNHMPFCLSNVDYTGHFEEYVNFKTIDDMMASLKELENFTKNVFPDITITSYVPPSNILSDEGRSMIRDYFPGIKVIASTYFEGGLAYEQEFEVSTDGIIEFPRVISGCELDNFMKMGAFSELNLHYVNSHFMHPDDVLDPDRGAEKGWESLKSSFNEYLSWLYTAAPGIRNLTVTDGAQAIETFDHMTVKRTLTETNLLLELGGFNGSAYLMLRFNEANHGEVSGGTLEHISGNLYLLHAEDDRVNIELKR